jgi:hypothetical protein
MVERKITVAEVEQIVAEPDGRISQTKDKVILYKKLPGRKDNNLAAVLVERLAGDLIEVITVLVNFEVRK